MRILITNDDGINAPGLETLHAIASDLAGPEGEVWTVAPAFEQSGVGHCISYTHPTMLAKLGPRRYAAEGSPADCVLAGLYEVMKGNTPDLVLSGVNRGNNAAENVVYSGTIGAAMEAALHGVRAVALSQYFGKRQAKLPDPFEAARAHGPALIRRLLERAEWGLAGGSAYHLFYNVNFPPCPAAEVKGSRAAPQGRRQGAQFGVDMQISPSGRKFLWVQGAAQDLPAEAGSDAALNLDDWISVTPLRADLTARDQLAALQEALG